jgi:hypothetical protein
MDSFGNAAIAEVLQRLRQEADAADAPLMQTFERGATTVEQAMSQVVEAETKHLTELYHRYAGIGLHNLPADPSAIGASQEGYHTSHIVGLAQATHRDFLWQALNRLVCAADEKQFC